MSPTLQGKLLTDSFLGSAVFSGGIKMSRDSEASDNADDAKTKEKQQVHGTRGTEIYTDTLTDSQCTIY